MWDFFETVRRRHSIRKYLPDRPVEKEKLHAILETASAAPSAGDLQSYRIIVATEQRLREAIRKVSEDQPFISEAPVCIAFCSDPQRAAGKFGERGRKLYALQDATIAAAYAQLAAVAAGLASTWVGHFDAKALGELLELPPESEPVAVLSLGYPAELPEPSPRRHLQEMVTWR